MTQRFKDLLDDAVSGVEPRTLDPAAAIVRRGRSQRRRTVLAGALAVVAVLSGGGLAAQLLRPDPPPRVADLYQRPPVPYITDGVVVSGALRLPVPAGWQAMTAGQGGSCADPKRTVLVMGEGKNNDACPYAAITVSTSDREFQPPAYVANFAGRRMLLSPPISMTLPGGEPAWLSNALADRKLTPVGPAGYAYSLTVVLPWSSTEVELRMSSADARRTLDTLRTEPDEAGVLAVPDVPAVAELTVPGPYGEIDLNGNAKTTDKATIAKVVRLLREQDEVIPDNQACANPEQPGLRLSLGTAQLAVALGGNCQEAVSSAGGRVRFDDAAVAELQRLFGIVR